MTSLYNAMYSIFGVPFGFILNLIYEFVGNYSIALIIFTILTRLLMLPASISQQKGMAKSQRTNLKLKKIRERYAGDQKKIQEETQAFYQREGTNPMNMGCLPTLITFPFLIGIMGVIYRPLSLFLNIPDDAIAILVNGLKELNISTRTTNMAELAVIQNLDKMGAYLAKLRPETAEVIKNFDFRLFGLPMGDIPNLKQPSILWSVPILSGLSSMASGLFMMRRQKETNPDMAKNPAAGCTWIIMPLFSVYFTFLFPVGAGIYWIISNVIQFVQTLILSKTHSPKKMLARLLIDETVERKSRENNRKVLIAKIQSQD